MILLAPEKTTWTSTWISCRQPAFWQLQFFLFQFQFLLIFKILISEMYAIIVLQCLAIYLCLPLYARLILPYWRCTRTSIRLLLRSHLCSQAIKQRHFTLSPEEKHSAEPTTQASSHLLMKQQTDIGNELLLRKAWIMGKLNTKQAKRKDIALFFYSKCSDFPVRSQRGNHITWLNICLVLVIRPKWWVFFKYVQINS